MILFYNILLTLFFPLVYFVLKLKLKQEELRERLKYSGGKADVWIHASSVGEVNGIREFVKRLHDEFPHKKIVLTTMTVTGKKAAESVSPEIDCHLIPLDFPFVMKSAFSEMNPEAILIAETEIWPNMLSIAAKRKVPVCIINARLSEKSVKSYIRLSFLFKPLFNKVRLVIAQSEENLERFVKVGFRNVIDGGNLKFSLNLRDVDIAAEREKLFIDEKDFVITWGSSRPGEEQLINDIFPLLNDKIENLRFIIVPRHLNRLNEVCETVSNMDFSLLSEKKRSQVIIVDKMGVLPEMYAVADLCITGGSFVPIGGHNPLEAAYYAKPGIIGEYYENCRYSVEQLKKHDGIVVSTRTTIMGNIIYLYDNPDMRMTLGRNGKDVLEKNRHSLQRHLEEVGELLN